jgi:hypothetical protein
MDRPAGEAIRWGLELDRIGNSIGIISIAHRVAGYVSVDPSSSIAHRGPSPPPLRAEDQWRRGRERTGVVHADTEEDPATAALPHAWCMHVTQARPPAPLLKRGMHACMCHLPCHACAS